MMKRASVVPFFLILAASISCAAQKEVQDEFTADSNYFDYEYYDDDISDLDTFDDVYDYPYYEEPEYIYDTPAPPVLLEEPPEKNGSDWFFEEY